MVKVPCSICEPAPRNDTPHNHGFGPPGSPGGALYRPSGCSRLQPEGLYRGLGYLAPSREASAVSCWLAGWLAGWPSA